MCTDTGRAQQAQRQIRGFLLGIEEDSLVQQLADVIINAKLVRNGWSDQVVGRTCPCRPYAFISFEH